MNIAVKVNVQGQGHMVPEFNLFRGSPSHNIHSYQVTAVSQ